MLPNKMFKVLIAGGGLTSSATTFLLNQKYLNDKNAIELSVWDKARGAGGRMSTSRSPHDRNCFADLGAQYISATPKYREEHNEYYNDLVAAGILEPLEQSINNANTSESGTQHFVTPNGMSSLVKYYYTKSGCQPQFDHQIQDITRKNDKWSVSTLKGHVGLFDAVVLTMPTPQVLQLKGTLPDIFEKNPEMKEKLENVQYSSRYALGLFYEEDASLNLPFSASYLCDDPVFRFIAVDNIKRNRPGVPTSVVLHTSVPFGLQYIEHTTEQVEPILLEALRQSFPQLPSPKAVKCQKWRYSQVTKSYEDQPGVVELSRNPLLLVGGDGFTHSNFDGCISSAEKIAEAFSIPL